MLLMTARDDVSVIIAEGLKVKFRFGVISSVTAVFPRQKRRFVARFGCSSSEFLWLRVAREENDVQAEISAASCTSKASDWPTCSLAS